MGVNWREIESLSRSTPRDDDDGDSERAGRGHTTRKGEWIYRCL